MLPWSWKRECCSFFRSVCWCGHSTLKCIGVIEILRCRHYWNIGTVGSGQKSIKETFSWPRYCHENRAQPQQGPWDNFIGSWHQSRSFTAALFQLGSITKPVWNVEKNSTECSTILPISTIKTFWNPMDPTVIKLGPLGTGGINWAWVVSIKQQHCIVVNGNHNANFLRHVYAMLMQHLIE